MLIAGGYDGTWLASTRLTFVVASNVPFVALVGLDELAILCHAFSRTGAEHGSPVTRLVRCMDAAARAPDKRVHARRAICAIQFGTKVSVCPFNSARARGTSVNYRDVVASGGRHVTDPNPVDRSVSAGGQAGEAALAFVRRLRRLDVGHLEAVGRAWRTIVANDPPGWFAAESAIGRAVRATDRRQAQENLLAELTEVVRRRGWWRLDHLTGPDGQGLTEAGVQYAATLAAIALLVRDVAPAQDVELIYGPFAAFIPAAELDQAFEAGARHATEHTPGAETRGEAHG